MTVDLILNLVIKIMVHEPGDPESTLNDIIVFYLLGRSTNFHSSIYLSGESYTYTTLFLIQILLPVNILFFLLSCTLYSIAYYFVRYTFPVISIQFNSILFYSILCHLLWFNINYSICM